jgi:hypothetical protein
VLDVQTLQILKIGDLEQHHRFVEPTALHRQVLQIDKTLDLPSQPFELVAVENELLKTGELTEFLEFRE